MAEALPQHKSTPFEDRKSFKELQEARMSGKAAPEVDVESGKMINPHNPEYITKRPWYLGESGPSLNHHAVQKKDHLLTLHEADVVAATRKKKQPKNAQLVVGMWVEGLKFGKTPWLQAKVVALNLDGSADLEFEDGKVCKKVKREHVKTAMTFGSMVGIEQEGKLAFDAKRDRWHGYDPSAHKLTVDRYNRMDDERRKRRQAAKDEKYRKKQSDKDAKAARAEGKLAARKDAAKGNGGTSSSGGGDGNGNAGEGRGTRVGGGSLAVGANGGSGGGASADDDASDQGGSDSDQSKGSSDSDSDYDSDSDAEEDDDADDSEFLMRDKDARDFQGRVARQGGVGGAQMKTTTRNLRIREDTAKYLRNLDPNSAYYDPKTRSMRDNPLPNVNPEELPFAGDNFERISGDAVELAKTTVFAWEATERSHGEMMVDSIANPSQVEYARQEFEKKKASLEASKKQGVFDRYGTGGAEALDADHEMRRLAAAETEAYVEYGRDGRVVRGAVKAVAKSKYPEDVLLNNHTQVWGSFFDKRAFRWGFGDDHSVEKNSYSTGEAGRAANEAAAAGITTGMPSSGSINGEGGDSRPQLVMVSQEERRKRAEESKQTSRAELYGEQLAPTLDPAKLAAAVKKEEAFQRNAALHDSEQDDKKRKYNSFTSVEVTPEEMEAYRMRKGNDFNDPMAKFQSDAGAKGESEAGNGERKKSRKKKSKKHKKSKGGSSSDSSSSEDEKDDDAGEGEPLLEYNPEDDAKRLVKK